MPELLITKTITTPLPFDINELSKTNTFENIYIQQKSNDSNVHDPSTEGIFNGSSIYNIDSMYDPDFDGKGEKLVRITVDIDSFSCNLSSSYLNIFSALDCKSYKPFYDLIIGDEEEYNRVYDSIYTNSPVPNIVDSVLNRFKSGNSYSFSNIRLTILYDTGGYTTFEVKNTKTGEVYSTKSCQYDLTGNDISTEACAFTAILRNNGDLSPYKFASTDEANIKASVTFDFGLLKTDIEPLDIYGTIDDLEPGYIEGDMVVILGSLTLNAKRITGDADFNAEVQVVDKELQPDVDDEDIDKNDQQTDSSDVEKEIEDNYVYTCNRDILPEDINIFVEINENNVYPLEFIIDSQGHVHIKDTYYAADRKLYVGSKHQFLYHRYNITERGNVLTLGSEFKSGWDSSKYIMWKNGYLVNNGVYWVVCPTMDEYYENKKIYCASTFIPGDRVDLFYIEQADDMGLVPYNRDVYMSSEVVYATQDNQEIVPVPYPNRLYPRGQKMFFVFTQDGIFLDNRIDFTLSEDGNYISLKDNTILPTIGSYVTFVFPYVKAEWEVDGEYDSDSINNESGVKFFYSYSLYDPEGTGGGIEIPPAEKPEETVFGQDMFRANIEVQQAGTKPPEVVQYEYNYDLNATFEAQSRELIDLSFWFAENGLSSATTTEIPEDLAKELNPEYPVPVGEIHNFMDTAYHLESLPEMNLDTSQVTNFRYIFQGVCSLGNSSITVPKLDFSNGTKIDWLFNQCRGLRMINGLNTWNIGASDSFTLQGVFSECNMLQMIDISNWDTSKCTNFAGMFSMCSSLSTIGSNTIIDLASLEEGTQYYKDMFKNCNSLSGVRLANVPSWFDIPTSGLKEGQYTILSTR